MSSLITKLDDLLNAILIKELRQTVRGKFFWIVFFLLISIIALMFCLAISESDNAMNGDSIADSLLGFLFFTSFFLIPLNVGKKINTECDNGTHELLFITTMTPKSIVWGKFLCGFVIILMFYCSILPFIFLTLFLGGIDVYDLFNTVILSFLLSNLAVMLQIAVGLTIVGQGILGIILKSLAVITHFCIWIATQTLCHESLRGYVFNASGMKALGNYAWYAFAFITIFSILYLFAVSRLNPETSNKLYAIRIVTFIIWVIASIEAYFSTEFRITWIQATTILLGIASVIIHSESYDYTERVKKDIPDAFIKKVIKFPFISGAINGFSWIWLISILTIAISYYFDSVMVGSSYYYKNMYVTMAAISAGIISYINTLGFGADFFRRVILKNYTRKVNIAIMLIAFLGIGILPSILCEIFFRSLRHNEFIRYLNPFITFDNPDNILETIIISVSIMVITLLLNFNPVSGQIKTYFNYKKTADEGIESN